MTSVIEQYGVRPAKKQTSVGSTVSNARFSTLNEVEERLMLRQVATANRLLSLWKDLQSSRKGVAPTLSEWAEAASLSESAIEQIIADGASAKDALIATNVPLVFSIVYKHYGNSIKAKTLSMRDLVQDGICGLMHAVDLYDEQVSKGSRLRTYAWLWVRAFIDHGILDNGHAVKLPRRARDDMKAALAQLRKRLDRDPTEAEIAEHLNVSGQTVHDKLPLLQRRVWSLDTAASVGSSTAAQQVSADALRHDSSWLPQDLEAEMFLMGSAVRAALSSVLSEKEAQLLQLRYGIEDGQARTVKECARLCKMSSDSASRLINSSMAKLRAHIMLHDASLREWASSG